MSDRCGAVGGECAKGPKRHHKCDLKHVRSGGQRHPSHNCKYCGSSF